MKDLKINVGELIFKGILQSSEISKGFWFPSLITMLCQHAGVIIRDNEERLPPGTLITKTYVHKLSQRIGERGPLARQGRPRAQDTNDEEPPALAAPVIQEHPDEPEIPSEQAQAAPDNDMLQILRQLRRDNRQTRREFRLRHEHIDENLRRNDDNMRFYWSAAGYDTSQYQNMTPWADSSQAAQWNNGEEEEEDDDEQHVSSEGD